MCYSFLNKNGFCSEGEIWITTESAYRAKSSKIAYLWQGPLESAMEDTGSLTLGSAEVIGNDSKEGKSNFS